MDKSIEKILDRLPVQVKEFYINNYKNNITEIRVRTGFDIKICINSIYHTVYGTAMNEKAVFDIFYSFCDYTISAFENQIANGFITLQGGHRVGIAGVFTKDLSGKNILQKIISMNIRIANFKKWDIPDELLNLKHGLLIAGGPHSGKTTFIKTLCLLNDDRNIVICDERNEIYNPIINQDFIINIPKSTAIEQAVRTMNPDIIICDEIGNESETKSIISAVNNGAAFICSVHTHSIDYLYLKPNISALLQTNVFDKIVFLENNNGLYKIGEIRDV